MSVDKKKGWSRRDFLKALGMGGLSTLVAPQLLTQRRGTPPQIEHEHEILRPREWTRQEYLTNPLGLIDDVLAQIEIMKKDTSVFIPPLVESIWDSFSLKKIDGDPKSTDQAIEFRKEFRAQFEAGFKLYGAKIAQLADRIDTICPSIYPEIVPLDKGSFHSFTPLWHSLGVLKTIFLDKKVPPSYLTAGHVDKIISLRSWFEPLTKGTSYVEQRKIYIDKGTQAIDNDALL